MLGGRRMFIFGTVTAPSNCWRTTWNHVRCCWNVVCLELYFILNRRQGRTKLSRTCSGEFGSPTRSGYDFPNFRPLSLMVELWSGETIAQRHLWQDAELVNEGLRVFKELARPVLTDVLLATDLHAGNALRSQRERFFFIGYCFCSSLRLRYLLFSTVFLYALFMSRSGSVPVEVQLEKRCCQF